MLNAGNLRYSLGNTCEQRKIMLIISSEKIHLQESEYTIEPLGELARDGSTILYRVSQGIDTTMIFQLVLTLFSIIDIATVLRASVSR